MYLHVMLYVQDQDQDQEHKEKEENRTEIVYITYLDAREMSSGIFFLAMGSSCFMFTTKMAFTFASLLTFATGAIAVAVAVASDPSAVAASATLTLTSPANSCLISSANETGSPAMGNEKS